VNRLSTILGPSCLSLVLAGGLSAAVHAAGEPPPLGFVDGSAFLELAGDDAGTIEISLRGALLRALTSFDPELKRLVGGLESIHAVIVEPEQGASLKRVRELVRRRERSLLGEGWERLARVRDGTADVTVLVLNDEETIRGLVVMAADEEDGSVVFANVAGVIDLAAIAALGEQLEIPGLDQVGRRGD